MGILKDIFGGKGEKVESSHNKGERSARDDYVKDAKDSGGKDPVPTSPPSWAEGLGPKDSGSKDGK